MKICIVGSRSITEAEKVFPILDKFIREQVVGKPTIISGGASGVDKLTKEFAKNKGFDFVEFLPYHLVDHKAEFNSMYFFVRNRQMIDNADKVLAIWNGSSKGTEHAIKYSQKKGIPIMVVKMTQ